MELRRKDLAAAEKNLVQAIALDVGDVRAHLALAEVLEKRGDVSGALAIVCEVPLTVRFMRTPSAR